MSGRDGPADVMQGRGAGDVMKGGPGADRVIGGPGNDKISGRDRSAGIDRADVLSGGPGHDALSGGPDEDLLVGDAGPDELNGGGQDDAYAFYTNAWGNDTISDTTDSDNATSTGNFVRLGTIDSPLSSSLTISLVSSADSPEVRNANLAGKVNWSNNAVDSLGVFSTTDGKITGNAAANVISVNYPPNAPSGGYGVESHVTISSGAGNDEIYVMDHGGGDTVNCGEDGAGVTDTDWVYADVDDTITNCEHEENPPSVTGR